MEWRVYTYRHFSIDRWRIECAIAIEHQSCRNVVEIKRFDYITSPNVFRHTQPRWPWQIDTKNLLPSCLSFTRIKQFLLIFRRREHEGGNSDLAPTYSQPIFNFTTLSTRCPITKLWLLVCGFGKLEMWNNCKEKIYYLDYLSSIRSICEFVML